MPDPDQQTLSHIDAVDFQRWMAPLMDIKGEQAKPVDFDTSKVIPVLDISQGGFSNQAQQTVSKGSSIDLAGLSTKRVAPGPSTLFSVGLDGEESNAESFMARIHAFTMWVDFSLAGAAAMNDRYIEFFCGLRDDTGGIYWFGIRRNQIDTERRMERYGATDVFPAQEIVFPGQELVFDVTLQPDYSGAAGPAVFPVGTTLSYGFYYTKKEAGGQLPL